MSDDLSRIRAHAAALFAECLAFEREATSRWAAQLAQRAGAVVETVRFLEMEAAGTLADNRRLTK